MTVRSSENLSSMDLTNRSHCLPLCVFALLVLFDLAAAASEPARLDTSPQERAFTESGDLNCETARSSDYYGLGVRIGVYFAWISAWIANVCVPDEIPTALDTNAVFLFATLLSMVRCTLTGILLQMDGLMLMHIGGGTIFSVLSLWGHRTCTYDVDGPRWGISKFGGVGTHLRLLLCMSVSTYGLFFWYWGIDGYLNSNTDPGCGVVYTFMFAKVRADGGGIRVFYIIVCIGCMMYFGSMLLASLVAVPTRLRRFARFHKKGSDGKRTRHRFATGLNQQQLRYIFYFLRIANFMWIIYSMLLVEFSLNYNRVAGVLGWQGHIFFPSQIIPLIIGAFSFCRVIWVRYRKWKNDMPDLEAPRRVRGNSSTTFSSVSSRSLFRPKESRLLDIYTPKSDVDKQASLEIDPHEIHPLMLGQALWLRLLVSWLPWLGVLRWWKPQHDDYEGLGLDNNYRDDPESNGLMAGGRGHGGGRSGRHHTWSSNESTPRMEQLGFSRAQHGTNTWRSESEDTVALNSSRMDLPRVPRKPVHSATVV